MTSDATVENVETSETEIESPKTVVETAPATETKVETPNSIADLALKMNLKGKVSKITLSGAFIDIGVERVAFLHISQLSTKRVNNVTDVLKEGDEVSVYVLDVNQTEAKVMLTMIKPPALTWGELKQKLGQNVTGTVIRVEKFGAFVDIGAERPGLIHVSELSEEYVGSPTEVVEVGAEVEARIIGVDEKKRQIDLSIKAIATTFVEEEEEEEEDESLTAMAVALRKAMGSSDNSKKRRKKDKMTKREKQDEILARTLNTRSN